jgi:hypothetical protein
MDSGLVSDASRRRIEDIDSAIYAGQHCTATEKMVCAFGHRTP